MLVMVVVVVVWPPQTFTTEHTTGDVNDLHGMTCLAHTTLDYNQPRLVSADKQYKR